MNVPSSTALGHAISLEQRLDYVAIGVGTIGSGALLAVAAQIMGMMQANRVHESN